MKKVLPSLLVASALILTGCGATKSSKSHNSSKKESVQKVSDNNSKIIKKYNDISLNTSESQVIKQLGKPNQTTNDEVMGIKNKVLTWINFNGTTNTITASFQNDKLNTKNYTNSDLQKNINKKAIKNVKNGANHSSVIKKVGTPTSESITNVAGINTISDTYTNIKDNYVLTYTNNALSSKSEEHNK